MIGTRADVLPFVSDSLLGAAVHVAKRLLASSGANDAHDPEVHPLRPVLPPDAPHDDPRTLKRVEKRLIEDARAWLAVWADRSGPWTPKEFHELIESVRYGILGRGGTARILFVIDDVDRCGHDVLMGVFDLHRTMLERWGALLVYPMNATVVMRVVERDFLEKGGLGAGAGPSPHAWAYAEQARMWMEKMFFRRMRPPEPSDVDLNRWLESLLPSGSYYQGLGEFIRDAYGRNPRHIKLFAGAVAGIIERFRAADGEPPWEGLAALGNQAIAQQYLTKVAAFGLAARLVYYYAPARRPDPRQLVTCEVRALEGASVPFLYFDPELRTFELGERPAPGMLVEFLKAGPRLGENLAATRSALLAVESILPPALSDWRSSPEIEEPTGGRPLRESRAREASPQNRERVQEVVAAWQQNIGGTVAIPGIVADTLRTVAPVVAVEVFARSGWTPTCRALLEVLVAQGGERAKRDNEWLLCAAAVHPELSGAEMTTAVLIADRVGANTALRLAIADVFMRRVPAGEIHTRIVCGRELIRANDERVIRQGLTVVLEAIGRTVEGLQSDAFALDDRFTEALYPSAVAAAEDALVRLKLHEEGLRLALAAVRTPSGRAESGMVRNLARVLRAAGRGELAQAVYDAAIIAAAEEVQACWWADDESLEAGRRVKLAMTGFDRDRTSAEGAFRVGQVLHNVERRDEATPWLSYAVVMMPDEALFRDGLAKNLRFTRGAGESARAVDPTYVPTVDAAPLIRIARDTQEAFLKEIVSRGPIACDGVLLMDPDNLPAWVRAKFGQGNTP